MKGKEKMENEKVWLRKIEKKANILSIMLSLFFMFLFLIMVSPLLLTVFNTGICSTQINIACTQEDYARLIAITLIGFFAIGTFVYLTSKPILTLFIGTLYLSSE